MVARQNYGPVQLDNDYRIIEESSDWVKAAVQGKAIYVPRAVFYGAREAQKYQEDQEDY